MKNLITLSAFVFCLLHLINLNAQQKEYKHIGTIDYVHLRSGNVYSGKILEYTDGNVILEIGNATINLQKSQISKIIQREKFELHKKEIPDLYEENIFGKRSYYSISLQSSLEYLDFLDNLELRSLGLHFTIGKRINSALNIGIGTGVELLYNERPVMPLFIETRGTILKRKFSPIYNISMGYIIPVFKEAEFSSFRTGEVGGLYIYPSIGMNISNTSKSKMFIDVGLKLQEYRREFENTERDMEKAWINNFVLRLGTLF